MSPRRLMIVDDDARICRLVERAALGSEFETLSVTDSGQFDATYTSFEPDALFIDLQMSRPDGVELLRLLAAKRSHALVTLVSGASPSVLRATTDLGASMGLNMTEPLPKPLDLDTLRERLGREVTVSLSDSPASAGVLTRRRLARALRDEELVVHYQPVLELGTQRLAAVRALVRWQHPRLGLLEPDRFVPMAEESGLVGALTTRVLESALENLSAWRAHMPDLGLNLDLPVALLRQLDLPDRLGELLRAHDFPAEQLTMEVTGRERLEYSTEAMDVLTRLRLHGMRLACCEGLGGQSSLERMQRLPFDVLALAAPDVADIVTDADAQARARAVMERARALGLTVIANGVDTLAQARSLVAMGCAMGRGVHVSEPLESGRLLDWQREREQPGPQPSSTLVEPLRPRSSGHGPLPEGYGLHWYEIESVLGAGGFGTTYVARDTNLNQRVAIKEYLPGSLARRMVDGAVGPAAPDNTRAYQIGLRRFIKEARILARFRHPNIVRVYSVFEANGTAYMIMEYERGRSLAQLARERRLGDEAELLGIVRPLLEGLSLVHEAGFVHRDIKPDNIFLRDDGVPVLLDFGSARRTLGSGSGDLTTVVTPGFAPIEQYNSSEEADNQGPWTDVYSLGATLYKLLTGRGPADAVTRANSLISRERDLYVPLTEGRGGRWSPALLEAVDRALAFQPKDRPQSIAEWLALFPTSQPSPAFHGSHGREDAATDLRHGPSEDRTVELPVEGLAQLRDAAYSWSGERQSAGTTGEPGGHRLG